VYWLLGCSRRGRLPLAIAVLSAAIVVAGPAQARAEDPTGTYSGTQTEFDFGEPAPSSTPAAMRVEPAGPGTFTIFLFRNGVIGSTDGCGTSLSQQCVLYTATFNATLKTLTGTGVRKPDDSRFRDLPFSATLSGNTLTGRADWQSDCGTGGCYYQFAVTRSGAPPEPPATTPPPPTAETPAPAGTPAPAPPTGPATAVVVKRVGITEIAALASPRSCVSRRKFPIRLRAVKANRIVRAQIKLNGRQVRNVTGKALGLPIDLRGLPKGRFAVEIVTTDATGKKLVGKRSYRTCLPKRR
jgi:hypothetical protein